MANSRLNRFVVAAWCFLAAVFFPHPLLRATGGFDDTPPPTLPYYLDRLPAKPPSLIFEETYGAPQEPAKPTDFKKALLSLAADCEKNRPPAEGLAATDKLLVQARLDPTRAAALCNLLEDVRDLFASAPPAPGKAAARYIRWRVDHADSFNLVWDPAKSGLHTTSNDGPVQPDRDSLGPVIDKLLAAPEEKSLRAHWLYLRGACDYPTAGADFFQRVVDEFPDDPRAEVARFMLARCKLVASRSHGETGGAADSSPKNADDPATVDRNAARALFEDYLKRYPQGRFVADVPGWLGALAFDAEDYSGALDEYIRQAEMPGHPEVLKSAGFMCERCLSRLASANDTAALDKVSLHPRLAMSLIYLLVNSPEADNYDGKFDSPAQVARWRAALLPRLATVVAAHQEDYKGHGWQGWYLAILAQAASGTGDQAKALTLCAMDRDELARSDDLAFAQLVALGRARRLPEAIAAADEFARRFPKSPLARGAALRRVLALVDNHQAALALAELSRLRKSLAKSKGSVDDDDDAGGPDAWYTQDTVYPTADADLDASRSVLSSDISGAQSIVLAQIADALLNFAPLPELAAALAGKLDGADTVNLRAVLAQRWLAEEENFAEAKKYATPAQWSGVRATLEKLTTEAAAAPAGEARAAACQRLANAWADARGQVVFAPLETDKVRGDLFTAPTGAEYADVRRRENGLALGLSADAMNHALSGRDEWQHASRWWQKAADEAPTGSPARAKALWSALRAMPSMALASPCMFLLAGEADWSKESHRLYDRLRRECPDSREAREFAVYYDLKPPEQKKSDDQSVTVAADGDTQYGEGEKPTGPDPSAAALDDALPTGEPEYRWDQRESDASTDDEDSTDDNHNAKFAEILSGALALNTPVLTTNPPRLAREVGRLRAQLDGLRRGLYDLFLVNFLDDLDDFLQEPADKLKPAAVRRYLQLRTECMSVEHWGTSAGEGDLPPVPGATEDTLNETVYGHIREAYRAPEMAAFKDYLDFLAMAVVANSKFEVPIPGETEDAKYGDEPGKKEPVTYTSRDYPKLARLTEGFLKDHPHSRKREAVWFLYARALYAASRPHPLTKFAVWPHSPHFAGGTVIFTHRQAPFEPQKIGAALNGYDREFPHGRYAGDIRNLRGLLAWRTQNWPLALDLTLQTLADKSDAVLQGEASRRLLNLFGDGLTDETERRRCLTAIKARPEAVARLREFLPDSPYPLRALQEWLLAEL